MTAGEETVGSRGSPGGMGLGCDVVRKAEERERVAAERELIAQERERIGDER